MSKKITFGSSDGFLIYDMVVKQKILDYLYTNVNLSKHRFIMLNNVSKLEFLKENEHYISPCFKGFNYFLLFMNLPDKDMTMRKHCIAIDRKKLSYHKEQVDLKTAFMVKLHIKVSDSIFNGTIFDGRLIESSNRFIFLIQDCFYLMNKNLLDIEMNEKMTHLDSIFKLHFSNSNICSNFNFKLNKLYKYEHLYDLINNIMPNCTIPTQGIVFYPKTSGISISHIEKKIDKINIETTQISQDENTSYHIIYNFIDFIKTRTYSYETGSKSKILWLSKTEIPDVYNISETDNGERKGIAHIPNIKISHLCDELVKNDKNVPFNCVYNTKFKKWIPISAC